LLLLHIGQTSFVVIFQRYRFAYDLMGHVNRYISIALVKETKKIIEKDTFLTFEELTKQFLGYTWVPLGW
jgi:hypothetical protein